MATLDFIFLLRHFLVMQSRQRQHLPQNEVLIVMFLWGSVTQKDYARPHNSETKRLWTASPRVPLETN